MSQVTHMNESCHRYEVAMLHTWKSHATHMKESRHTYERVTPHTQINVTEAQVAWLAGTEATEIGANRVLNVGCTSRYVVRATGGQYPVLIQPAPRLSALGEAYIYTCIQENVCMHMYACECIERHTLCVCMYVHTCMCIYRETFSWRRDTLLYVRRMYASMYVCMYVCMYACMFVMHV